MVVTSTPAARMLLPIIVTKYRVILTYNKRFHFIKRMMQLETCLNKTNGTLDLDYLTIANILKCLVQTLKGKSLTTHSKCLNSADSYVMKRGSRSTYLLKLILLFQIVV